MFPSCFLHYSIMLPTCVHNPPPWHGRQFRDENGNTQASTKMTRQKKHDKTCLYKNASTKQKTKTNTSTKMLRQKCLYKNTSRVVQPRSLLFMDSQRRRDESLFGVLAFRGLVKGRWTLRAACKDPVLLTGVLFAQIVPAGGFSAGSLHASFGPCAFSQCDVPAVSFSTRYRCPGSTTCCWVALHYVRRGGCVHAPPPPPPPPPPRGLQPEAAPVATAGSGGSNSRQRLRQRQQA